ncbi:MotA/TolQ/ExbB proton channel family protein [Anatilimnocola aggregata]|uniref:MotA/TolQ/ExbB proton channel family protein n=1 Tax=Anatilimnocola aggregata TaxID=2528021 RepID=A0A517YB40_9BACT|nr:MotA/TolQ/ExbB proton channel family protein [Anatilimnocola aggregata]QDU27457.1 MotA/TolQ/ExbB proton channel family protein [Anatilimnocola aggregata]
MSQEIKSPAANKQNALWSLISGVGWPLMLGLGLAVIFYALIYRGPLHHPSMIRYFGGHPINIIETALFFIGLVALINKMLDVIAQQASLGAISLGEFNGPQPTTKAGELLDILSSLSKRLQETYLGRRLTDALEAVERNGSADKLEEELKYLSDMDGGRQQESYSLVRIIIWATPMLGFLGTVVGITAALGDLGKELGSQSADAGGGLQGAMTGLLAGLYVAFDTTAIALCFSIVLMFIQYGIDRVEMELLGQVDKRAAQELIGRFEMVGASSDPQLQSIHRMTQLVVAGTEQLVLRQAELWQQTIHSAHGHWDRLQQSSGQQLQASLTASLTESLEQHATHLARIEHSSAEHMLKRWEQWQGALNENAKLLYAQQQEMARQGELMTQAIRAAGDVVQLEKALNSNLSALAGSKNFEETVMSLAAAIHLLNSRLGRSDAQHVELGPQGRSRAA